MGITDRIFEICEMYNISDRHLSLEAGLNHGYMNKTREMDREIGSLKVEKIYKTLNKLIKAKINPEWYLIGVGPKFLSGYFVNDIGNIVANEDTILNNFEYQLHNALDNEEIIKKLKEVLDLK